MFDFREHRVGQVMTPRTELDAVAVATPWPDVVRRVATSRHQRLPIYADDLMRGWRIDVRTMKADGTPATRWQSLNQRDGAYTLAGGPAFQGKDEGWVEMAVTEQPGPLLAASTKPYPTSLFCRKQSPAR